MLRRLRYDDADDRDVAELAALADGTLPPDRRAALEARASASPHLADRLAEQQRALALTRSAAATVEAPAALRERIQAQRRGRRTRARGRLVLVAAAATASAAAIAIAVSVGTGTSGEGLRAALAPTALAPGAKGEATFKETSSGWLIDLHASQLPHRTGGRFYEAWLRSRTGRLVPVGTFNDGRDVKLWSGVSPRDFRTLIVTREVADGRQAPSGQTVLIGTVKGYSG